MTKTYTDTIEQYLQLSPVKAISQLAWGYDDVLLEPNVCDIPTRKEISLATTFCGLDLTLPIISAPMDSVTQGRMARAIGELGGLGIIHRYQPPLEQQRQVRIAQPNYPIGAAVGVKEDYILRAKMLVDAGVSLLVIDVAHGDHTMVWKAVKEIRIQVSDEIPIVAGNIATPDAVRRYHQETQIEGIRIGVGSGAHCTTRIETGVGVPQLTAVLECCLAAEHYGYSTCADGGIRFAGDIVKALAAGADAVMCGKLLAGTQESPGNVLQIGYGPSERQVKEYRGMASFNAKITDSRPTEHLEGISEMVPYKGPVVKIIDRLVDGIRSGCSYVGARNLDQLRKNARFIQVTSAANHLHKML